MEGLLKDVGQTLRSLRRSLGFTLACIAALALGIGGNATIFSVVNTVLLKPLSFPNADRVVWFSTQADEGTNPSASPAKSHHLRQQSSVVEDVSAVRPDGVNYTGSNVPEQLQSLQVSASFLRLLQAPIVLGRGFSDAEELPNDPRVVLLGQQLWERRFDGNPGVLDQTISLGGGHPYHHRRGRRRPRPQ